jgi:murein DD-endopeptidase MepM/ murein hydrolase activator NlpD
VVYQPSEEGVTTLSHSNTLLNLYKPVKGYVRNPFSRSEKHYGIDIVSDENATVFSATDGFVIFAEYSDTDGHVIGVANKSDVVTFYKHNSSLLKKVGSPVLAGEAIAIIGNSGENSSGPHLHFELWFQGVPVDPMDYYASFE